MKQEITNNGTDNAPKLGLNSVSGSALSAAFDVVFTMDNFLGNVIATGDPTIADLELKKKCEKYLRWYKKHYC